MTDLPDAVVNAAVEAFARKRNPKHSTLDHSETLAIRAALAAASGPWAEQLDAAKADRDQALLRLKRIIELEPVAHAAEQIRESDGSFTTEIAGVRLEKCDEYGRTKTTAERDAALARNAELERDFEDEYNRAVAFMVERDALRAELDNLRETLAQKVEAAVLPAVEWLRDRAETIDNG